MKVPSTPVKYPRVYISASLHKKVKALAKKMNVPMSTLGNKIVKEGLEVIRYNYEN